MSADDAARMRRLEELFHRAADLGSGERRQLLDPLRAEDPELVAELERLLDRADRGRDLSAAHVLVAAGGGAMASGAAGAQLGPYRLVERIGKGGMGEVYRAERVDGQYVQTVAVKVIREGLMTPGVRERLRAERQILARLEHPHIARLLDGGVAADGSPYLVMEYVEGRPITAHCDRERLPLGERLELFRTVCAAVQHAHRNLVVHRDLKPSNILVGADGRVKLLDFGIAKLLAPDGAAGLDPTQTVTRLMTPGYASPEQVRGEPVTTATDVYALGLLLYELLCGRRAQAPRDSSLTALERAVCEEDPPRPSDALGVGGAEEVGARLAARGGARLPSLRRQLRGDLDAIVATALRKDPARRYASAQQMLDDVERHLAGQPVVARPDTLGYRVGKLLRRHRLAAAASTAVALSLVLGLVLALTGLVRAQRAEERALAEAAVSERIAGFLVDLFRASDPGEAMGATITARELLDRGAERVHEGLTEQPAVQAALLGTMAQAYESLGLFAPAAELTQQRLALESARAGAASVEAARVLLDLSDLRQRQGDYAEALELARRALAAFGPESRPRPEATDDDLAGALHALGVAHAELGELEEAGARFERALAIRERAAEPSGALRTTLNSLAILRWQQGEAGAARSLFERALAIAERDFGAEHPEVAHVLNNLALVHRQAGDPEAAIAAHERALAIREAVLAADHPDVAESLSNLADVLRERGDPERARRMLERALAIRETVLGPDHAYVGYTLNNLGLTLLDLDDAAAARPPLERALAILERAFGPDHAILAHPLIGLARVAAATGDPEAAEDGFRRALELRRAKLGDTHPDYASALRDYATFLKARDRPAEARALEEQAERIAPEPR